jgi:hypothetical protein
MESTTQRDFELDYLAACQRLVDALEAKNQLNVVGGELADAHQALLSIGDRINRDPDDRSHEYDYLAALQRAMDELDKKNQMNAAAADFSELHAELVRIGRRLGYDRSVAASDEFNGFSADSDFGEGGGFNDMERQIAELQAQIRSMQGR